MKKEIGKGVERFPKDGTSNRRIKKWTLVFGLIIAAIFLYLSFRDVDWLLMWKTAVSARIEVLAGAFILFSMNQFLRGGRWQVLLTVEKKIPLSTVFWANNMGYFGNNFLPARAGEFIRTAVIGQVAGIGMSYALATALTERVMDAVILVFISLLAILSIPDLPASLINATIMMTLISFIGMVGMILAPFFRKQIEWVIGKIIIYPNIKKRVSNFLDRFLDGMKSLMIPGRLLRFLGYSIIIWALDGGIAIVVGQAFRIPISFPVAMIIIAALGLSSAIPSTPGYIGVYQFAAVAVMTPFGFLLSDILVFILAYQVLGYVGLAVWGGLGFWQMGWHWFSASHPLETEKIQS